MITITADPAYQVGAPDSGTVTISDNDQPTVTDAFAQSEITDVGSIRSGDLTRTFVSDDSREVLREGRSGSSRSTQVSLLEHEWTFDVTPGSTVTFMLEAHHTSNGEGDDFVFSYSSGAAFIDMITVTKTADDHAVQSFWLPNTLSGLVTVRVVDLDRTPGNRRRDRIKIDYMVIRTVG